MPAIPRVIRRNKDQVRQFSDDASNPSMFALPNVLDGIATVGEPVDIPTLEPGTAASETSGAPDDAVYGQVPISTLSRPNMSIDTISGHPSVTEYTGQ